LEPLRFVNILVTPIQKLMGDGDRKKGGGYLPKGGREKGINARYRAPPRSRGGMSDKKFKKG